MLLPKSQNFRRYGQAGVVSHTLIENVYCFLYDAAALSNLDCSSELWHFKNHGSY